MPAKEAMSWDELARTLIQSIVEDQGGLVAANTIFSFISPLVLVLAIGIAAHIIKKMQKEMDRQAEEKKKLERQILKKPLSSNKSSKK